jgi:hypothetical protein
MLVAKHGILKKLMNFLNAITMAMYNMLSMLPKILLVPHMI